MTSSLYTFFLNNTLSTLYPFLIYTHLLSTHFLFNIHPSLIPIYSVPTFHSIPIPHWYPSTQYPLSTQHPFLIDTHLPSTHFLLNTHSSLIPIYSVPTFYSIPQPHRFSSTRLHLNQSLPLAYWETWVWDKRNLFTTDAWIIRVVPKSNFFLVGFSRYEYDMRDNISIPYLMSTISGSSMNIAGSIIIDLLKAAYHSQAHSWDQESLIYSSL